jgi:anti-anti-sigma factor
MDGRILMKAEFRLRVQKGIAILDAKGEIDDYGASVLKTQLNNLIDEGHFRIALNFKDVDFIDTTCLGVLCSALSRVGGKKGEIELFGLKPNVRKLFDVTRLCQIFKIYDTEAEALSALSGGAKNVSENRGKI